MAGKAFQFGEFKLDCDSFELSRAGRSLKLERKPMELLILLTERNGQLISRTEIAERLWGSEVFVDTEHGINTAIRKIRNILRDDSEQPPFIQTVTGRGYRFIGPIEEVSSVTAGAALPTEGDVDSQPISQPVLQPIRGARPPMRRRRWLLVLAATAALVLLLAVAALITGRFRGRAEDLKIRSIAVLPIDNLTGDPGQNYFADGMTDELTTMLAKDSTLSVTSRTSVMQYKGVHRPLREIAHELGVDGILEGSVSRSGNKVHMTIQLIQAATDKHVWADGYDRDENDLVSLPREAAQAIAKRLNSALAQPTASRYVSPEAHDAYLRGIFFWNSSQNERAGEYFRKATELQPDYAMGWIGVSKYYGGGALSGELNPAGSLALAEAAAGKAAELDDSLPMAHVALGASIYMHQWNWDRALEEIDRAIQLDPKLPDAYHMRARILGALNRHQEAIEADKKSIDLLPGQGAWAMARVYLWARQCDTALSEGRLRLESNPLDEELNENLVRIYECKGMKKEAIEEFETYLSIKGDQESADGVRASFQRGGYDAALLWQIQNLKKLSSKRYVSPVALAALYGRLGRREDTLAQLEEGLRQHSPLILEIQNDTAYDFVHSDERYRSIVRRIGLPPAW